MKKLSDYTGEQAVELWAEIMPMIGSVISDGTVKEIIQQGGTALELAGGILGVKAKEVAGILTAIDPTPVSGLNIIGRLVSLITEVSSDPALADFFALTGGSEKTPNIYGGSATENTEDGEK